MAVFLCFSATIVCMGAAFVLSAAGQQTAPFACIIMAPVFAGIGFGMMTGRGEDTD